MSVVEKVQTVRIDREIGANRVKAPPAPRAVVTGPRPSRNIPRAIAARLARSRHFLAPGSRLGQARRAGADAEKAWAAAFRRYAGTRVQDHLLPEDLGALGLRVQDRRRAVPCRAVP